MYKKIIIDDKETLYSINEYGKIRNDLTNTFLTVDKSGKYKRIVLYINGKRRKFSIHRLVASVFIGFDINNKDIYINHIDGDKSNNFYKNLEISDCKRNAEHAAIHDLVIFGENHYKTKYNDKIIHKICKLLEKGYTYQDISNKLNISYSYISHIANNETHSRISSKYNISRKDNRNNYKKYEDHISRMICNGLTNKEILDKLNVSRDHPIRYHIKRLRSKMKFNDYRNKLIVKFRV